MIKTVVVLDMNWVFKILPKTVYHSHQLSMIIITSHGLDNIRKTALKINSEWCLHIVCSEKRVTRRTLAKLKNYETSIWNTIIIWCNKSKDLSTVKPMYFINSYKRSRSISVLLIIVFFFNCSWHNFSPGLQASLH